MDCTFWKRLDENNEITSVWRKENGVFTTSFRIKDDYLSNKDFVFVNISLSEYTNIVLNSIDLSVFE